VKAQARGKLSWAMIGVVTLLLVLLGFIIGKKIKL
jgi:putative Mn2+ efflux pump MntP